MCELRVVFLLCVLAGRLQGVCKAFAGRLRGVCGAFAWLRSGLRRISCPTKKYGLQCGREPRESFLVRYRTLATITLPWLGTSSANKSCT